MARAMTIIHRWRTTARHVATPVLSAILNFVYPPVCLMCGCEAEEFSAVLCEGCLSKLKPQLKDECPRCGASVGPYANLVDGCGQCRGERFAFDRVIRLGLYEKEMRQACLRAKASDGSAIARGLAEILAHEKRDLFAQQDIELVLPVPEHWTRRFIHSHYAAETISRAISHELGIRWSRSVLIKSRRTPKQATSSTAQRRQQQAGSFSVRHGSNLAGKTILLVDDILTTGSTADAASRQLKSEGAKKVIIAVLAVSPLRKIV